MGLLYKPVSERAADSQYRDLLREILEEGRDVMPLQGERSRMVVGRQLRYKIANGFPVITERDLSGIPFAGALGEHIGFLHGARTLDQLAAYGCPPAWWEPWVTEERCAVFGLAQGDLGGGSYGPVWRHYALPGGLPFDQLEHLIRQLRERPERRTHVLTSWMPHLALHHEGHRRDVVVAPCHGVVHVLVFPEERELVIHHFQRSGDLPVGVAFNMIQYAAFGAMLAQMLGYAFTEIVYTFSDVHIYERQFPYVERLIAREPRALPTVTLAPAVTNLFVFRPEHFTLTDYDPHPRMKIPTPV